LGRDANRSSWLVRVVGRGHKVALLVGLAALLAAGALLGVAWAAGFTRVSQQLLHPHWAWLGIALAAEMVAYVGYTFAYRDVARAERGAELRVPKAVALVATGFGVFIQGGGFALDREALKRSGLPEREARARVLGLGALEYTVLAPAALVAASIVLLRRLPVNSSLTIPCDIACLWAALHAFNGQAPPVAPLIIGYASGYAITRRALPLGGAGVVEALLPFTLAWVAIPLATAMLAVLAYRLMTLWLPMVPALAGLPALHRLERRPRPPARHT
jgi:uncharacterized membrane protein YbhN (UPF0104 family)